MIVAVVVCCLLLAVVSLDGWLPRWSVGWLVALVILNRLFLCVGWQLLVGRC